MRLRLVLPLIFLLELVPLDPGFAATGQDELQAGELAIEQGNFDEAIDFFSFRLDIDPKNGAAHTGRGMAYLRKGDVQNALNDFTEAIRLDPKAERAYAGRARSNLGLHEDDKVIADTSKAVEINPMVVRCILSPRCGKTRQKTVRSRDQGCFSCDKA